MGSQLAWWLLSRLRLTPTIWVDTSVSPSDPPLDWTPSPRDLMLLPRELLLMLMDTTDMDTTDLSMERDLLTPTTWADTLLFPSDLPLVLTPSPRDLMPLPRDMLLMLMDTTDTDTTDSSTERGPLMLMLIMASSDTMEFPSDPPLVWTPSPRDLMPPPRDMLLMLMDTTDSTELTLVKFDGKSGCDCYGFIYWTH